jgi:hypothetical protein
MLLEVPNRLDVYGRASALIRLARCPSISCNFGTSRPNNAVPPFPSSGSFSAGVAPTVATKVTALVSRADDGIVVLEIDTLIFDFASAIVATDAKRPIAINARSKVLFQPGIGPHSEAETLRLVLTEMAAQNPERYGAHALGVPYPEARRQRCDLCFGEPRWCWAVEAKLLRFLGDNGQPNDNIVMHILSPYPGHRSALTDCAKLAGSSLGARKAILIYGFNAADWPLEPAIAAFEVLARSRVNLGTRISATFDGLVHPVHRDGAVFGWEVK